MSIDRQALEREWCSLSATYYRIYAKWDRMTDLYFAGVISEAERDRKGRKIFLLARPVMKRMQQIERIHGGPFRCHPS